MSSSPSRNWVDRHTGTDSVMPLEHLHSSQGSRDIPSYHSCPWLTLSLSTTTSLKWRKPIWFCSLLLSSEAAVLRNSRLGTSVTLSLWWPLFFPPCPPLNLSVPSGAHLPSSTYLPAFLASFLNAPITFLIEEKLLIPWGPYLLQPLKRRLCFLLPCMSCWKLWQGVDSLFLLLSFKLFSFPSF